jgi:hypothetical protein
MEAGKTKAPSDWHGLSLMPAVLGKSRKGPRPFAVTSRTADNAIITTDRFLFQPYGEGRKPALFDRKADPLCKKNLYSKHKDEARKLHKKLIKFYHDHDAKEEIVSVIEQASV